MSWDQINENLGWLNDNFTQYLPSGQLQRMMGRLHLAMPYSDGAQQDATATISSLDPNSHSLNWFESNILGITPQMKADDLQNDRTAFYRTPEGQALQRQANLSGFKTMTGDGTQRNLRTLQGELSSAAPNILELADQGVTYRQIGLSDAANAKDKDGNLRPVGVSEIQQRATAFKNIKAVKAQLTSLGETPKAGATLSQLNEQLKQAKITNKRDTARIDDEITYGTRNPDGTRTGGTEAGRQQMETHQSNIDANKESIKTSQSTRRVNEGNLAINQVNARNSLEQTRADNDWRRYVYDDSKAEAAIQRQYEAGREDARYAARAKEIQMQNDADMKRYQLMLENDREVRRSEDLGDLFGALAMLGGAFMI